MNVVIIYKYGNDSASLQLLIMKIYFFYNSTTVYECDVFPRHLSNSKKGPSYIHRGHWC